VKIHLKQISAHGSHLEGEEPCAIVELETDQVRCAGPLHYQLEIGITGNALWASGILKQPIELQCVSCLQRFVYTIEVPAFALHTELSGPETIDLTPFFREDLLLNLPPHPRCDREGGRECRAATPDYSKLEEQEREAKREHDWEALDKLKLKRQKS
jgi:DUF177 domain-containing protein